MRFKCGVVLIFTLDILGWEEFLKYVMGGVKEVVRV